MSNYLERYRKRQLGLSTSIKEREIDEMKNEFMEYLKQSPTAREFVYTQPDELPDLTKNQKHMMAMVDCSDNDKTSLDEKYLEIPNDCNIDVGSYVHSGESWYIVIFEEEKTFHNHKKFVARRCNNLLRTKVDGKIYEIPISISYMTMYSKGENNTKYISEFSSSHNIYVGANPITIQFDEEDRVMLARNKPYSITNVNDVEGRRHDYKPGLIKWLCYRTVLLKEDDIEEGIAYNPNLKGYEVKEIKGNKFIFPGEENDYSVEYDGQVEFILDRRYPATSIMDNGDNTCTIIQDIDYDVIGDVVILIARDKDTKDTLNTININIRGL